MSDDIRTRIAAVLLPDLEYAAAYNPTSESPEDWAANLADAVIRELGLRQDTYQLLTRYVTQWEQNG